MAGKRHHFIPRFLQEGFASHRTSGGTYTWVYRRNTPPYNPNIINVGIESQFYTGEEDSEADDIITTIESSFSTLIQDLRTESPASLSDPQLPQLIAHLEIRTRHLRESIWRIGDFLVSKLLDFMSDNEAFADYMERRLRNDPSILRESISDELAKRNLPQALLEPMMKLSEPLIPALIQQQRLQLPRIAAELRSTLPIVLKQAAKSGHIKSLKKSIAPEIKVQRYQCLSYFVATTAEGPLILGDSAVIFHVEGPRPYKAFLDQDDILNAVFLPLNAKKVLVGARPGLYEIPHGLREAIARCSLEYFIATENSDANQLLKDSIGEDAAPITQTELEELIGGLIVG